ncbi:hypothetical protein HDU96_002706, partial [Phlyctochytrium bullatum]
VPRTKETRKKKVGGEQGAARRRRKGTGGAELNREASVKREIVQRFSDVAMAGADPILAEARDRVEAMSIQQRTALLARTGRGARKDRDQEPKTEERPEG